MSLPLSSRSCRPHESGVRVGDLEIVHQFGAADRARRTGRKVLLTAELRELASGRSGSIVTEAARRLL